VGQLTLSLPGGSPGALRLFPTFRICEGGCFQCGGRTVGLGVGAQGAAESVAMRGVGGEAARVSTAGLGRGIACDFGVAEISLALAFEAGF